MIYTCEEDQGPRALVYGANVVGQDALYLHHQAFPVICQATTTSF